VYGAITRARSVAHCGWVLQVYSAGTRHVNIQAECGVVAWSSVYRVYL